MEITVAGEEIDPAELNQPGWTIIRHTESTTLLIDRQEHPLTRAPLRPDRTLAIVRHTVNLPYARCGPQTSKSLCVPTN